MGIKRCPSFSKRPGFPCGLRVLLLDADPAQRSESEQLLKECSYEVTPCSSTCEALSRLSSACSYDVLLADKSTLSSSNANQQQLLEKAQGLPCIFMACNPSQDDVLTGVELGAVDFLAKPLSPLKLKNIWQHTVRKMMCNMNINCIEGHPEAAAAAMLSVGKQRVSMEVIMEEVEEETAAADTGSKAAGAAAAGPGRTSNAPNMALAITSSFYEPSRVSLSRSGSSALTTPSSVSGAATEAFGSGPDSPIESRPTKQQHCKHGPVRSCPSTRSLSSMNSIQSSWQFSLPSSPSSPNLHKEASDAAAAAAEADTVSEDAAGCKSAQRLLKKAVRHPAATAVVAAPAPSAGKPPLAGKPATHANAPAPQGQQATAAAPAPAQQHGSAAAAPPAAAATPSNSAGAASPGQMVSGLSSIPLPVGLGPLPQGMVWGMPMCPLARAPGIVPPASSSTGMAVGTACATQAGSMASMPMGPWGMCSMPTMYGSMPPPFMAPGYGSMMPGMGMAMPYAGAAGAAAPSYGCPSGMMAAGMPATGCYMDPSMQQMAGYYPHQQEAEQQQQQPTPSATAALQPGPRTRSRAAAAAVCAPTGAAAAAAWDASLAADMFAASDATGGAAAATAMDDDAFDFVLGDITAEDDLTDVCGSLLDGDLSALDDEALKSLPAELEALEADMQKQQIQQVAAAAANRCSFECSNMPRQRISFDCSTASTCTAARASFETSHSHNARVSFEVSTRASNRVSFEVSCCGSGSKGAAAGNGRAASMGFASPAAAPGGNMASAASAPANLLGSMSDLFAACSGDSSCDGLPHVDSCGMLKDLQELLDATGDSCGRDGADSTLTGAEGDLFADALEDIPLELALKKSNSLADLINAGLAN